MDQRAAAYHAQQGDCETWLARATNYFHNGEYLVTGRREGSPHQTDDIYTPSPPPLPLAPGQGPLAPPRRLSLTNASHPDNHMFAAELSRLIYEPDDWSSNPQRAAVFEAHFCSTLQSAHGVAPPACRVGFYHHVKYAVIDLGHSIAVVFRGTDDLIVYAHAGLSIATGVVEAARQDDFSRPSVPRGYWNLIHPLYHDIFPMLRTLINGTATDASYASAGDAIDATCQQHVTKPVWFMGHSLGGAYAALSAYAWHHLGGRVGGVYTFGTLPPGNTRFAADYNDVLGDRTFRYELALAGHPIDTIPRLLLVRCGTMAHVGAPMLVDIQHRPASVSGGAASNYGSMAGTGGGTAGGDGGAAGNGGSKAGNGGSSSAGGLLPTGRRPALPLSSLLQLRDDTAAFLHAKLECGFCHDTKLYLDAVAATWR